MVNLKKSFEEEARSNNDILRHVVVGVDNRLSYKGQKKSTANGNFPVESWETASAKLDYLYDSGFGGVGCHAVIAWGDTHTYYVAEYDGSTYICSLPKSPIDCIPGYGYYKRANGRK